MGMELAVKQLSCQQACVKKTAICITPMDLVATIKARFAADANLVLWQRQNIVWGIWQHGEIVLSDKTQLVVDDIIELRVFNATAELHLERRAEQLWGRYLEDGIGEENFYVDSFARFWGEKVGRLENFVQLQDKSRKIAMAIPCSADSKYYGLTTRNYVSADAATGQSGYSDYRYLEIASAQGE